MNERTLQRISKNPHYKMSKEQKIQLGSLKKKPMIQFGEPMLNDNSFAIHDTSVVQKREKYEKK